MAAADATERELADAVTRVNHSSLLLSPSLCCFLPAPFLQAKLLRTENSELLAAQKEWRKKVTVQPVGLCGECVTKRALWHAGRHNQEGADQ